MRTWTRLRGYALAGEVVLESGKLQARFDYRHSKSVLIMARCWLAGRSLFSSELGLNDAYTCTLTLRVDPEVESRYGKAGSRSFGRALGCNPPDPWQAGAALAWLLPIRGSFDAYRGPTPRYVADPPVLDLTGFLVLSARTT